MLLSKLDSRIRHTDTIEAIDIIKCVISPGDECVVGFENGM